MFTLTELFNCHQHPFRRGRFRSGSEQVERTNYTDPEALIYGNFIMNQLKLLELRASRNLISYK